MLEQQTITPPENNVEGENPFKNKPQKKRYFIKRNFILILLFSILILGAIEITFVIMKAPYGKLGFINVSERHHSAVIQSDQPVSSPDIQGKNESSETIPPIVLANNEIFEWTDSGLGNQLSNTDETVSTLAFNFGQDIFAYVHGIKQLQEDNTYLETPTTVTIMSLETKDSADLIELMPTEPNQLQDIEISFSKDHNYLLILANNTSWIFNTKTFEFNQLFTYNNLDGRNLQLSNPLFSPNNQKIIFVAANNQTIEHLVYNRLESKHETISMPLSQGELKVVDWLSEEALLLAETRLLENNIFRTFFQKYDLVTQELTEMAILDGSFMKGTIIDQTTVTLSKQEESENTLYYIESFNNENKEVTRFFKTIPDQNIELTNIYPTSDLSYIYSSGMQLLETQVQPVITRFDTNEREAEIYIEGANLK